MPRYVIYARKSTEDEDRQILSLDSQVKELQELAVRDNLPVVDIIKESRSAKAPGRPHFDALLRLAKRGAIDGIIAWKLDRLARNPVDGAALIWAMELGKLREVVIPGKRYTNRGDDKFAMQMEFGIAKKYVDDLSDNVKRGNRAKLDMGWYPGFAKLGYLNDRLTRTIVIDPERFSLIKRIWRLILARESPIKVYRLAIHVWGLRTRPTKRGGGGPLSVSAFYDILGDPFYCGIMERPDGTWLGRHEPMISREEFDQVQRILGRPNRLGDRSREFAFTGLIRCGECGCSVTAEKKVNRYGRHYTYYHCTKKKIGRPCSQRVIRLEELERQILSIVASIEYPDPYLGWARRHLTSFHADESATRGVALRSLEQTHDALKQQLRRLTNLRLREILPEEEFLQEREGLVKQELSLREARATAAGQAPHWLELSENAFSFANQAEKRFRDGSLAEKREVIQTAGSNLTLRDKTLAISLHKPFVLMTDKSKIAASWALAEGIRTFFTEHPTLVQWPKWVTESVKDTVASTLEGRKGGLILPNPPRSGRISLRPQRGLPT